MEFCFIYEKCSIFALFPLVSAVLRAFFLMNTNVFMYKQINPLSSAPQRQKAADFVSFKASFVQGINLQKILFDVKKCDIILAVEIDTTIVVY